MADMIRAYVIGNFLFGLMFTVSSELLSLR